MSQFDKETISLVKGNNLFNDLTQKELSLLLPLMHEESYDENTSIIREGEKGEDLYIIKKGEVEVFKEEKNKQKYSISKLGPGQCVGEMALVGTSIRSATVRTTQPSTFIVLPLAKLYSLSKESLDYSKILFNLAEHFSNLLKETNEIVIRQLKNELKLTKIHDQMGRLTIYMIILLVLYFVIFKAFTQFLPASSLNNYINSILILCLGCSTILLVKNSGFPMSFFGITKKHWQHHLLEGILLTIPFLVAGTLFKAVMIYTVPRFHNLSLFYTSHETSYFYYFWEYKPDFSVYFLAAFYVLLVPIQEFLARGYLQSILQQFFRGSNHVLWAIITSNLLFWIFHGLHNLAFATTAFLFGLFWGWLYAKQRSLVGPTISHMMLGGYGFSILSIQDLFVF